MSMTDDDRREAAALEPFFAAVRADAPAATPDLMARVLEAAGAEQARFAMPEPVTGPVPRAGLWARIQQGLGGWPALGGLAAAGLAGVWIGLALPEALIGGEGADYVVDVAPVYAFEAGEDF